MNDEQTRRLSADQVLALRFAAHRQLARWSNKPKLSPRQHAQRTALTRAVRILQDHAFTDGCDLRACTDEENVDG
ncbi:MAG: hypothetical protein ACR2H2_02785 [Solirubrobacteraceae bacterium]